MRLLSLNIWGGRVYEPLMSFLKSQKESVDIFCLQEVFRNGTNRVGHEQGSRMDIWDDISKALQEFTGYHAPKDSPEESLAIFTRKSLVVENAGYIFVHEANSARTLGIPLQYVTLEINARKVTVANLHGWWRPNDKEDTPERLEQSKRICSFLDTLSSDKVLCGDFNLSPHTKSLRMLEKNMRNLIKEYNVLSTRTHLYPKENRFADYCLVSHGIMVQNFQVLPDVVSDHAPLCLDFS